MLKLDRYLYTAIAVGLAIKAAIYGWVYVSFGLSPAKLMTAHDGHEYLTYAQIIGSGAAAPLPVEVLRHDPGLPLLLSGLWLLSGKLLTLPLCALIVQVASWAGGAVLIAKLFHRWFPEAQCRASYIATATLGYPALLYYGQFNLTEPLFIVMILGSILLSDSGKYGFAFILAGLSAFVRSTGLLLVLSLLMTHPSTLQLLKNPRLILPLAAYTATGLGPWVLTQVLLHNWFNTNFSVYEPRFGLPFSGFQGLDDAGAMRSTYIIGSVLFFIVSASVLVLAASKSKWKSQLRNAVAAFAVIFLGFHLCLKTLYYIDRQVWTFDYQDRYLAPLWPLVIGVWYRWINWPLSAGLIAGSLAMAVYWMHNYLTVAGL